MGSSLFLGGTGNIISAFEKLMNEVGVKIIKGQEIVKINHENRKVKNIVLKNNDVLEIIVLSVMLIHLKFMMN